MSSILVETVAFALHFTYTTALTTPYSHSDNRNELSFFVGQSLNSVHTLFCQLFNCQPTGYCTTEYEYQCVQYTDLVNLHMAFIFIVWYCFIPLHVVYSSLSSTYYVVYTSLCCMVWYRQWTRSYSGCFV